MAIATDAASDERDPAEVPSLVADTAAPTSSPEIVLVIASSCKRWDVISDAMRDTGRTVRLCAILFASAIPPSVVAAIVSLAVRH